MSTYHPRNYQLNAISEAVGLVVRGVNRIIILAPTGAGKTFVASLIVQRAIAKGKRVLFIAHRRELIDQTADKLMDLGILNFGVIMAGNRMLHANAPVQVASIQTLLRRELPPADLIIIDEAHRAASRSYLSILANYPQAVVLGLTATPERLDGKGLDDIFEDMVTVETVPNLIAAGYLVKPTCYVGPAPDLSGVKIKRGDYDEAQLAEAMDKPKLVGDIIANWKRLAQGQRTAVFATNIAHAEHIAQEFFDSGIPAAVVTGKTPIAKREAIISDWRSGFILVVVNVGIFVEGFDMPELSCAILARPTKSITMYLQIAGRIMRPAPGKTTALILDHAGCCQLHGPPHIHREWTLEGMAKRRKDKEDGADLLKECPACHMVYESQPKLWLEEIQDKLRPAFQAAAAKLLRGRAKDRGMDVCPGCGAAKCAVCVTTFQPGKIKQDIDGIAWQTVASCPACHAHYAEEVPHLLTESTEPEIPDTTNDQLVPLGDEIPVKVGILNEYKKLLNEARENGRKRGWAYWRLRDKYDEELLRECLPRHTGNWWRANA